MITRKIGLLLGDETDWPAALEALLGRFNPPIRYRGRTYRVEMERVRIRPFALGDPVPYHLILDRLGHWHYHPREWLKKAALVDGVYLLNNPFTFQCLEKHATYAAMHRLGLNLPQTWLLPPAQGTNTQRYQITAAKYHDPFDLPTIARGVGYPVYLKPYDGAGWRAVSRIEEEAALAPAYEASEQTLMLLQAGLDGYDSFLRSLGIGPQALVVRYDPGQPHHARYRVEQSFPVEHEREAARLLKIINAFFLWDFNTCEVVVKDGELWPIDFANACPDLSLTSLHRFFPWVLKALLAWMLFCVITERRAPPLPDMLPYFRIADSGGSYQEKLAAYEALADAHFTTAAFEDFRATHLVGLDEAMWTLAQTPEFDRILVQQIRSSFAWHEHDWFIAHYRGLLRAWIEAEAP